MPRIGAVDGSFQKFNSPMPNENIRWSSDMRKETTQQSQRRVSSSCYAHGQENYNQSHAEWSAKRNNGWVTNRKWEDSKNKKSQNTPWVRRKKLPPKASSEEFPSLDSKQKKEPAKVETKHFSLSLPNEAQCTYSRETPPRFSQFPSEFPPPEKNLSDTSFSSRDSITRLREDKKHLSPPIDMSSYFKQPSPRHKSEDPNKTKVPEMQVPSKLDWRSPILFENITVKEEKEQVRTASCGADGMPSPVWNKEKDVIFQPEKGNLEGKNESDLWRKTNTAFSWLLNIPKENKINSSSGSCKNSPELNAWNEPSKNNVFKTLNFWSDIDEKLPTMDSKEKKDIQAMKGSNATKEDPWKMQKDNNIFNIKEMVQFVDEKQEEIVEEDRRSTFSADCPENQIAPPAPSPQWNTVKLNEKPSPLMKSIKSFESNKPMPQLKLNNRKIPVPTIKYCSPKYVMAMQNSPRICVVPSNCVVSSKCVVPNNMGNGQRPLFRITSPQPTKQNEKTTNQLPVVQLVQHSGNPTATVVQVVPSHARQIIQMDDRTRLQKIDACMSELTTLLRQDMNKYQSFHSGPQPQNDLQFNSDNRLSLYSKALLFMPFQIHIARLAVHAEVQLIEKKIVEFDREIMKVKQSTNDKAVHQLIMKRKLLIRDITFAKSLLDQSKGEISNMF